MTTRTTKPISKRDLANALLDLQIALPPGVGEGHSTGDARHAAPDVVPEGSKFRVRADHRVCRAIERAVAAGREYRRRCDIEAHDRWLTARIERAAALLELAEATLTATKAIEAAASATMQA